MYWDVTGIASENNARQTKLNQFNARAAEHRARRSRGLRRHARLRAAQHLRRRLDDARDARLRDLHRRRHQQPEAGRRHAPTCRATSSTCRRARSALRSDTSTARRTAISFRTPWLAAGEPRTCRQARPRAATTWMSSTAKSWCRSSKDRAAFDSRQLQRRGALLGFRACSKARRAPSSRSTGARPKT